MYFQIVNNISWKVLNLFFEHKIFKEDESDLLYMTFEVKEHVSLQNLSPHSFSKKKSKHKNMEKFFLSTNLTFDDLLGKISFRKIIRPHNVIIHNKSLYKKIYLSLFLNIK